MSEGVENNEGRDTEGLLDAQGLPVKKIANDVCAQAEDYIREQPLTAALIIFGVGFIIGRFRLII